MARELVKDAAAQSDLVGTWVYSFEHWGEALADRYQNALEQGIRTLADEPQEGKRRGALRRENPE